MAVRRASVGADGRAEANGGGAARREEVARLEGGPGRPNLKPSGMGGDRSEAIGKPR
jgi:hypothetical protein